VKKSKVKNALVSTYIVFSIITVGFIGFFMNDNGCDETDVEAALSWILTTDEYFKTEYSELIKPSNSTMKNFHNQIPNNPVAFTANQGQIYNDEILFYLQDGSVWFTDDAVWFEIRENVKPRGQGDLNPWGRFESSIQSEYKNVVLKQEFVGANQVKPVGIERLGWNSNFFYGNDSLNWCTDVPNFSEVYYENLYDGIDLRYYSNRNGLKYDFIVHPFALVEQIRIKYNGASKMLIDDYGNLVVENGLKNLVDGGLFIYQNDDGVENKIEGKFKIFNNLEYGFELLDDYNEKEVLVIDPFLEYSTFIGGNQNDSVSDIVVDLLGNSYVTGITNSLNFPTTPGVFNRTGCYQDNDDVFVLKLNYNGSDLLYSTFIGGASIDVATSIDLDSKGNAYITGNTFSTDFPVTPGAFNTSKDLSNLRDVFILKINQIGSKLVYSTFISGNNHDFSHGIAVDLYDNAIVSGYTSSTDFPNTTGAFDNTLNNKYGEYDIFVLKINQNG
jgi:hypothetical protein